MVRMNFRGPNNQASVTIPKEIFEQLPIVEAAATKYGVIFDPSNKSITLFPSMRKLHRDIAKLNLTPVVKEVKPTTEDNSIPEQKAIISQVKRSPEEVSRQVAELTEKIQELSRERNNRYPPKEPTQEAAIVIEDEPTQEAPVVIEEIKTVPVVKEEPKTQPVIVIEEPKGGLPLGSAPKIFPHDISPMMEHQMLEDFKKAKGRYVFLEQTVVAMKNMGYENVSIKTLNDWYNIKRNEPKEKKTGLFGRFR